MTADLHDLGSRNRLEPGTNPITRSSLGVTGIDSQLHMFEMLGSGNDEVRQGGVNRDPRQVSSEVEAQMSFLASEVARLQRLVTDSAEQSQRRDVIIRHLIGQMDKNIGRLAAAPGRRMAAVPATTPEAAAAVAAMPRAATPLKAELIPRPRTLHDLWAEWQVGGGGRKPAKDFNSGERGAVRSKYSFRKPFWEKVSEMIRAGLTAQVACDRIYACYGESLSVTQILRKMHADRRSGMWPDGLRVDRSL